MRTEEADEAEAGGRPTPQTFDRWYPAVQTDRVGSIEMLSKKTLETNRRPASVLDAEHQFGRALHT
jgi:hypothetical protein